MKLSLILGGFFPLLQAGDGGPLHTAVGELLFVPETVRTDVLFRDMQSRKVHFAVVVDEYGGTSGILMSSVSSS